MLSLSRTRISVILGILKMRKRSLMGMESWTKDLNFWRSRLKVFGFLRFTGPTVWAFPPILIGLLITGGPKAFLMALTLPLGQSTFSFEILKVLDVTQNKLSCKSRTKKR